MTAVEKLKSGRKPAPPAGSPTASARLVCFPGGQRREWRLRTMESSIPSLRRELAAFLSTTGLSDDAFYDLLLAASEAASNAVDHPQQPTEPFFEVAAEFVGETVTIVVQDHGRWLEPTPSPHRGRGLAMMRVLADTTVEAGTHGTTVTIRKHTASPAVLDEEGRAS